MRPQTRTMPRAEYEALTQRIYREVAPAVQNGSAGTTVFLANDEFQATQMIHEARWIMTDNPYDVHLLQVDSRGCAVLLIPT